MHVVETCNNSLTMGLAIASPFLLVYSSIFLKMYWMRLVTTNAAKNLKIFGFVNHLSYICISFNLLL